MIEKNDLPTTWRRVGIGEIAILSSGGTPDRGNRNFFTGQIPWVKSGELNYNIITKTEENITREALITSNAKLVPAGTLLIALYGSTVGKLAFLGIEASTNQAVAAIKTTKSFESKYLYYYLQHSREKLLQKRIGGAQPNISQKILQSFPVPLCVQREQELIVSQIDSLFSKLIESERLLKSAKWSLQTYKRSLLRNAFQGKLTNENIENNNLPKTWKFIKISDIANVVRGGSPRPAGDLKYYDGDIPFLKVKDLTKDDNVYLNTFEYTIKEAGLSKTRKIDPKTLLLSNSGATLGIPKICLINATINDGIAAFLNLDERSIYYLYYFLQLNTQKLREMSMGAAQPNLNTTIIKNIEVPYCSYDEQKKIVEIIEEKFSLVDNVERVIEISLKNVLVLRHSILNKAFQGKLVKYQGDDSVDVLLDTIKIEKKYYLDEQIKSTKKIISSENNMAEKKSIHTLLLEAKEPISAQELWERSTSDGDIERFYSEIKEIYDQINEIKTKTESLLTFKNENRKDTHKK